MRNFFTVVLAIILVAAIGAGAIIYSRLNTEITQARQDVQDLKSSIASQRLQAQSTANISMVDLITLIQPVIVRIDAPNPTALVSGSGVIIRSDGYIITNNHVIDSATSLTVTLSDGRRYHASVTGSDANLDLAILKLGGDPGVLPTVLMGMTADIVVGGLVVAGGFPLGEGLPGPASFTQGIVSAVRTLGEKRYIQSDVNINPGNSGGALVSRSNGRLIGITSAGIIETTQIGDIEGIGLAIPIDVILGFIQANLK
jgi:serine protease Do